MSKAKTLDINIYRHNFVLGGLRRLSAKWYPRSEAKRAARTARGIYTCAMCEKGTREKDTQMDHVSPVVDPIDGFVGWDVLIPRLLVSQTGWQVLCKTCHKIKTKAENSVRKKKCTVCKKSKIFTSFHKKTKGADGRQSQCKPCSLAATKKSLAKEGPKKTQRENRYKREYGISVKDFDKLLTKQKNKCKICGELENPSRRFAIDHCHDTDKVRGLLCTNCNTGIGMLKDDEETLQKAIDYLRKSK